MNFQIYKSAEKGYTINNYANREVEQMAEQAGEPKEKRFSPPKICLPSLYLPRLSPALLWIPVVLVALWAMWYSLDTAWNAIRPLFG